MAAITFLLLLFLSSFFSLVLFSLPGLYRVDNHRRCCVNTIVSTGRAQTTVGRRKKKNLKSAADKEEEGLCDATDDAPCRDGEANGRAN